MPEQKTEIAKTGVSAGASSHEILKPRWAKLEYTWQIDNFWEIRALGSIDALGGEDSNIIWSRRFGDERHGLWRLKCYPCGDTSPVGSKNVSLFLSLDTDLQPGMEAYAIFGCSILNDLGEKIPGSGRSYTRQKFSSDSNSWGWSQFIKVEGHSLSRMLAYDNMSLIVKCEVEVFLGLESYPGIECPQARSLAADIISYSAKTENCDVDIYYGPDGKNCYAGNTFLLSARCEVLENLLKSNTPTAEFKPVKGDVKGKSKAVKTAQIANSEDEFGSLEEENHDGALYRKSSSIKDKGPAPLKKVDTLLPEPTASIATLAHDENGRQIITIDPIFETEVVLAFLSHVHVGENALTSSKDLPRLGSTMSQICQLLQIAHRMKCTSLYWECVGNIAGRMVTKNDAIIACTVAREVGCKKLESNARELAGSGFMHPDKVQLIKVILPKSAHSSFLENMIEKPIARGRGHYRNPSSDSDE